MTKLVKVVLADNEDAWGRHFPKHFRGRYSPPTLVLFSGRGSASERAAPTHPRCRRAPPSPSWSSRR
ncbi:MAG: hypothetical protein ACKOWG_18305 [Planctomycetia bacterium]